MPIDPFVFGGRGVLVMVLFTTLLQLAATELLGWVKPAEVAVGPGADE